MSCFSFQTTQDAVRSKEVTLKALNKTSESLPAEYEVTTLPPVLKVKVNKLNADWLIVKELADNLEPAPADSSVHEVLAQGMLTKVYRKGSTIRNCVDK